MILDLYFKGISTRGISDHLKQFYNLSLHHSNIIRRIHRYSKIIDEYVQTLTPEIKDVWNHDEMKVKADGKWFWLWNVMDTETKYHITTQVSYNAHTRDSNRFFKKAREQAKKSPEYIFTDGRHSLTRSINKELIGSQHVMLKSLTDKRQNNQQIERLNGVIRDRIKPMRGFYSGETAETMTTAYRNYYNFIKPHNTLNGDTPATRAGIGVEDGTNKWKVLLGKSFSQKNEI